MIEAINFGNKLYKDILNEIKKSSEGKDEMYPYRYIHILAIILKNIDEITLIQGYLNLKEDKNGKN